MTFKEFYKKISVSQIFITLFLLTISIFISWLLYLSIDSGGFLLQNLTTNNTENKSINLLKSKEIRGFPRVVDGDSLEFKESQVRLLLIDAPEYKQTCFDINHKGYKCGIISKNFLYNLTKNKEVVCYYSEKDFYQRI